ncbi:sortase [Bacillus sp. NPDC094106]|uniref:sortase n=1 Tax=Bacillus sp. NPDC094106 TaxID=3363949 RepID=UPI0038079E25
MKKKILKAIGYLFVLILVSVLVAGAYIRHIGKIENDKMVETVETTIDNNQLSEENKELVSCVLDSFNKEEYLLTDNSLGVIEIPKMKLKVTIGEGTNFEKVKQVIGHVKNTALPGQKGNVVLEGASDYEYKQFFKELEKLDIKDALKINTLNGIFLYKITDKQAIESKKLNEYTSSTDTSIITLISSISPNQYLVIRGTLI